MRKNKKNIIHEFMQKIEPTKEERNNKLRAWLAEHPFINIAKVCRAIDYSRGTFARFESGHQDLGLDATEKLEIALIPYGYET